MEIIHLVLGKANPNRMNGVNKVVYQMAVKQTDFNNKVNVWGITADLSKNYEERNFETQLFLKSKNPFKLDNLLKKAILNKKETAIFHIHGGWIPVFYSISNFLKKNDIPFVFTPHGAYNSIAMKRSFWLKKIYFQLFEKSLLNNANKIHCIGKSEVDGLNSIFCNTKSILLPYGFENKHRIAPKYATNTTIIFGFIGRLDIFTKGLDVLLKSFEQFVSNVPSAQLWIVGDSNEKNKLEQLILKHKLNDNVTLFGSKFGEEKNNLLQQMDVFVHPSRNEGLPTSVIEAASFEKPCIVTDATNIGKLIEQFNAGITIKKLSTNQLYLALNSLYLTWTNDLQYKKMCKNAAIMVEETYNWNKVILDLNEKLYTIK